MENQVPYSTAFFCAHCEDEFVGTAPGQRILSGRPLCLRCTDIGESEGWGHRNSWAPPAPQPLEEKPRWAGIIRILFMLGLLTFALLVAQALFGDDR